MSEKTVLILERSSQNLKKISKDGRTVLEGVFAEFGVENRNGRVYEEREYLPHLEYLQKDIKNGNLLGELDHPERFEVSLGNVSHKISELWYDQGKRQILGRIEILDGTPKGQIAKSLLEAGVPLSISSRAAGSVNEDKSVEIQQIYTYDLVAKPGFENAQLHQISESANADPKMARIAGLLESFNKTYNTDQENSINAELGIINENISIIDVTDKFPSVKLREEAKSLIKKTNESMANKPGSNDEVLQEWTAQYNETISGISKRLANIENSILEGVGTGSSSKEIKTMKSYIEKIRKIQEGAINWQTDIAKAVNKVGRYSDTLAKKSNKHYNLTQKLVETVDHNAKTLNKTQDWIGENAKVTNAIGNTVDHNAKMLNGINEWTTDIAKSVNGINEWTTDIAKSVNKLNEWGEEKASAINDMHEWTSSIAKNLNHVASYSEDMFGRAMSKDDANSLIEYVEVVVESKKNPKLKKKINEMLSKHGITNKKLNEAKLKALGVLDVNGIEKVGNVKVADHKKKDSVDQFKGAANKKGKSAKGGLPKGLSTLDGKKQAKVTIGSNGKKMFVLDTTKSAGKKGKENVNGGGAKGDQKLKLDQKPMGKLKENRALSIKTRSSKLDERLDKIVKSLEKERALDETTKSNFPFTTLLSESDRTRFAGLSHTDKQKVANKVAKVPTTESDTIIKLWESALSNKKSEEPRWLELAPKNFKKIYEKSSNDLKESIKARSDYFNLDSQYQITDFWEKLGLVEQATVALNENVIANNKQTKAKNDIDPNMAALAAKMKSYNQ